jgi:4'-phosphopantetheinyl transferase
MMVSQPEIFCCPTAAVDDALLATYQTLLSAGERERLVNFRAPTAARDFIIGRALLRTVLAARLHCDPAVIAIEPDADGKPQLAFPLNSGWHFNLSHDRNWVVLIVSNAGPVGIDVECHERRNNLDGIAKRFFSSAENRLLENCEHGKWLDCFFAIWTLKEAHAKARGCGLAKILSCSSITPDWRSARINFALGDIARADTSLSGWLYRLDESVSLGAIACSATSLGEPTLSRAVPLRASELLHCAALARGDWRPR